MDLLVDGATGLAGRQALVGSSARVPVNIDSKDPILDLGEVICY